MVFSSIFKVYERALKRERTVQVSERLTTQMGKHLILETVD